MRLIIIKVVLLLSTGLAFGQGQKLAFRTLALGNSKLPELWAMESGKPLPIKFSSNQPSVPFKADRTSPFKIFKGPLNENGKPSDPVPSLVPIPATSSILLLGWVDDGKPAFLAIEDSFATMKSDDWLVINPSQSELAIQIGAGTPTIPVKANSHKAIKTSAPSGTGAAVTVAAKQTDGEWKVVYTSFWPIYDNQRGLVVVVQKGKRLNVSYISDQIAAAPAAKP
jgi:hypothetical protein